MSSKLDTHHYDGKLNRRSLKGLEEIKLLPLDEKIKRAEELICRLKDSTAINFMKRIAADFDKKSNFDKTNGLIADDLVCLCWNYCNNENFIEILELQLKDMSTGFCSQGRTHRLFQILLAFSE